MKRWLFPLALVIAFTPLPAASQHPRLTVSPSPLHLRVSTHHEGTLSLEAFAPHVAIEFDHAKSTCEMHHIAVLFAMHARPAPAGQTHYDAIVAPLQSGTCEMSFRGSGIEVSATIVVEP